MNQKHTATLVIAGIVAAALGIAAGYYLKQHLGGEQQAAETAPPDELPDFALYTLDGETVTKDELLAEDRALFFNFWATWCKPCREEMPLLSELQNEYAEDLLMVGVAIDNEQAVQEFLEHLGGVSYPILLGKQELDAIETANAMGIDLIGLPVTLTADRTGRIVAIHTGEVDRAEAEALIGEVLGK